MPLCLCPSTRNLLVPRPLVAVGTAATSVECARFDVSSHLPTARNQSSLQKNDWTTIARPQLCICTFTMYDD
ncbi:hypothetical protein E4T56_gene14491 [Termitomyces sp. T112]|nr:hypothetical protein E4T56_gene14491 [Termitomyces sp. T112]